MNLEWSSSIDFYTHRAWISIHLWYSKAPNLPCLLLTSWPLAKKLWLLILVHQTSSPLVLPHFLFNKPSQLFHLFLTLFYVFILYSIRLSQLHGFLVSPNFYFFLFYFSHFLPIVDRAFLVIAPKPWNKLPFKSH